MNSARRAIKSGSKIREVDIYGGFNKNAIAIIDDKEDETFQNALKVSSYGKRNTTPKTNWIGGDRMRTAGEIPSTAMARARPSTAIRPVGFSSETLMFDPFNQASKKIVTQENKKEDT
jgi:intraflagellar transport protein 88